MSKNCSFLILFNFNKAIIMKKNYINYYSALFILAVLTLSIFSCQTEQVSEVDVTATDTQLSSKGSKSFTVNADACTFEAGSEIILYAGRDHKAVGTVTITTEGQNYLITYNVNEGDLGLTETHVEVFNGTLDSKKIKNGNPIPGQFDKKASHDYVKTYTETVPISEGTYFIIHGVVDCKAITVENLGDILPDTVDFCVTGGRFLENGQAYFYVNIEEGALSGTHLGWCGAFDKSINYNPATSNTCYTFNVYTLADDISGIINLEENMDLANWLINANLVGTTGADGSPYTFGDLQWALWKLLDNVSCTTCNSHLLIEDTTNGEALYNLAIADNDGNGVPDAEGYTPKCGSNTLLVLYDGVHQPVLIPYTIPCKEDCGDTIWAEGCNFSGANWAMYFKYNIGS